MDQPLAGVSRVPGFNRGRKTEIAARSLYAEAQQAYVAGQWREATLGFAFAALVAVEIAAPPRAGEKPLWRGVLTDAVRASLGQTLAAIAPTRSRWLCSLRLCEACLDAARADGAILTREEALLACCLARKLAGGA